VFQRCQVTSPPLPFIVVAILLLRMRTIQIAAGILEKGDPILLIRQQGKMDDRPYWTLPGGKVEPGELTREILEETGLTISGPFQRAYLAMAFRAETFTGEPNPKDPDQVVLEARFFQRNEALRLIDEFQPLRIMKDPILLTSGETRRRAHTGL
jgi:ADP-ribose pyrophosphatase YjhB (NUDIX family)